MTLTGPWKPPGQAELSVRDPWLRYLGLRGSCDAFDIDAYLPGIMPLDPFEESILAQTLTEALTDSYDTYRTRSPPPAPDPAQNPAGGEHLHALNRRLLTTPPAGTTTDKQD